MPSQKSTDIASKAVAPKRRRGRDRVDAILAAAADLFAEKAFGAVTMTEVAARSGAAIGSLYRFFPTKEALADALLDRYGAALGEALDAIAAAAGDLPPTEVADALVDFIHERRRERAAALGLLDSRPDSAELRQAIRGAMLDRVAAIIAAVGGGSPARARPEAMLVLQMLKTIRAINQNERAAPERAALDRESRRLVRLYLEDISRKGV
jgi:AcrR family transcriptional regulator